MRGGWTIDSISGCTSTIRSGWCFTAFRTSCWNPLALDDESLAGAEHKRLLGLSGEEFVDRPPRSRAGCEGVIVEHDHPAAGKARIDELQAVEDRLVEVEVDVGEAYPDLAEALEGVRNPALAEHGNSLRIVALRARDEGLHV